MSTSFPDPGKELILARYIRRALEWMLAGAVLITGLVLLLMNDVFDGGQVFDTLAVFLPAEIWGTMYVVLGTLRISTLVVNGYWPHSPYSRYWLSGLTLMFMWAPIWIGYISRIGVMIFGGQKTTFLPGSIGFTLIAGVELLVMLTMKTWIEILKEQSRSGGRIE